MGNFGALGAKIGLVNGLTHFSTGTRCVTPLQTLCCRNFALRAKFLHRCKAKPYGDEWFFRVVKNLSHEAPPLRIIKFLKNLIILKGGASCDKFFNCLKKLRRRKALPYGIKTFFYTKKVFMGRGLSIDLKRFSLTRKTEVMS